MSDLPNTVSNARANSYPWTVNGDTISGAHKCANSVAVSCPDLFAIPAADGRTFVIAVGYPDIFAIPAAYSRTYSRAGPLRRARRDASRSGQTRKRRSGLFHRKFGPTDSTLGARKNRWSQRDLDL